MTARPLVEAVGLRRSYRARGRSGRGERVTAVNGVDLSVAAGEAVAVVGGSGAGKSTLVRLLVALERPDEGAVFFDGHEISAMGDSAIRPLRARFQPVFQDPLASLDPRMRIDEAVVEPLDAMKIGDGDQRRRRVSEVLDLVGLPQAVRSRYPSSLSGGERQRAAIARALAPEPGLLVLDEPVSSLDAPVALRILDLLGDLRKRLDLTVVLITHDIHVVRQVCDRVVVMSEGRIVEAGTTTKILTAPEHGYTRRLLAAVPKLLID
jgi:ABC-type glutathione transport system ATPase component